MSWVVAAVLAAVGVITFVVVCVLLYTGAYTIGYAYRRCPRTWAQQQLPGGVLYHYTTTEAVDAMVDASKETLTMRRGNRAKQPGIIGRRAIFFYYQHGPRGITLNHPNPQLHTDAVIAVAGDDFATCTAGARCYRRPWDHAIAVCADYQGPYQGVARNISVAETKRNPEPPTIV